MQVIGNNGNHLSDQLVYALKERQSAVNISTGQDGRIVARYSYMNKGKKTHLYVSADTVPAALDNLSRKVRAAFHPREGNE